MARALLVLACAACAAAARYGDYAGARMPQYGGDYDAQPHTHAREPDDYRGHSPDAPAALDYKYEEDLSNSQIGEKGIGLLVGNLMLDLRLHIVVSQLKHSLYS